MTCEIRPPLCILSQRVFCWWNWGLINNWFRHKNCIFWIELLKFDAFTPSWITPFTEIFQIKVKIWHFLQPCHHSNLKDTAVSFELIHTLAKISLTHFLSPDLKLHNWYCHNEGNVGFWECNYYDKNCQFIFFAKIRYLVGSKPNIILELKSVNCA